MRAYRRRLRVVWDPDRDDWIVQYDSGSRSSWVDALRFTSHQRAVNYVTEIRERDRILIEAER